MRCPKCNKIFFEEDDVFCLKCGIKLEPNEEVSSSPANHDHEDAVVKPAADGKELELSSTAQSSDVYHRSDVSLGKILFRLFIYNTSW